MTEEEWAEQTMPDRRLRYLEEQDRCDRRKARLFGVACCRRIWHLLMDERLRQSVEMAEKYADGFVSRRDMDLYLNAARFAMRGGSNLAHPAETVACAVAVKKVRPGYIAELSRHAIVWDGDGQYLEEEQAQLELVLDIFGNPFRPISFDVSWRTSTAVAIAQGMYESRDFSAMPILADALQDAGCENDDVLNHAAGGPHVRRCWVIDLCSGRRE